MADPNSLTDLEKKRYKLQIMLPGIGNDGQEKIKNARVLVAGIGGIGSQALLYLTAMGVGKIGFVDYDVIEEENLSHQVLYGMEDIGKLKALVTRKRLQSMNPLIRFKMLNVKIDESNAGSLIPDYDIVVDATNNREAHQIISDACIRFKKVMVYGCVCKMEGRLSVFNFNNGPSYRCAFPDGDETVTPEQRSIQGMPGILPGITGTYLANEVVKVITGSPGILSGKIMVIDVSGYNNRFREVKRNPENFKITLTE